MLRAFFYSIMIIGLLLSRATGFCIAIEGTDHGHNHDHHHVSDVPEDHDHISSHDNHTHNHCIVKSQMQNSYYSVSDLDNDDTIKSHISLDVPVFQGNPVDIDDNLLQTIKKNVVNGPPHFLSIFWTEVIFNLG